MMNKTNIEQTDLTQLVVTRQGELDPDYYAALRHAERAERLSNIGHGTLHIIEASAAYTARFAGKKLLEVYSGMFDLGTGQHTLADLREEQLDK